MRHRLSRHRFVPLAPCCLRLISTGLLLSLPVCAQVAPAARVRGTVTLADQSAAGGAQVTLTGSVGPALQVSTDASGQYTFPAVPAGKYQLAVHKDGFAPYTVPLPSLSLGQSLTADVVLALANTSSSVTVHASVSGTALNGYYVRDPDRGVLGNSPIVDQPYTITALPTEQIANTQVKSLRDAIQYLPLVSYTEQEGDQILRPTTRGFQGSIVQNIRQDGMAMAVTGANPLEQYQELQVENGLSAASYGPANPSGTFDFVLKRPTAERTTNLYLEQDSSSVGTIYGDAGGRLGAHKTFGYRTNLLYGDGTAFVAESRLRRRLGEFAFDARPGEHTTLDTHYSAYDIVQRGHPGWFSYGQDPTDTTSTAQRPKRTLLLPAAPDPTRPGFGQVYAGDNLTTQSVSARILHDFSPNWHAAAGGLGQRLDRLIDGTVNTLTNNTGSYSTSLSAGFAARFGVESDLGYITGTLNRWGLKQDLTAASQGYRFSQYAYATPSAASLFLGLGSVANPVQLPAPAAGLPANRGLYVSTLLNQQGLSVSDQIYLPKGFAVRLAASQDFFGADNYNATKRLSGSNQNGISPAVSVLYKPTAAITTYATYASSLQQGDIAPGSATLVNANQVLAPYRSKEWEIGAKEATGTLNLTTALFRLERPFAETVALNAKQNIFEIVGQQVNYGAEISAQGVLFHRWLVDGGFTALNARLNNTGIAATGGKRFVGIPDYRTNFYSEYRIPHVRNLSLTGDWQFTGQRPQDDENLHTTPGSSLFDLGFRYSHPVFSRLATLRFTDNNFTNTHYYSTVAAGDITGTNASSNTAFLGNPRTLSTSLQFAF